MALRRKGRGKGETRLDGAGVHHAQAVGAKGGHRGQRAHLAERLRRAKRQIEARRVGAVDDIDVVIARQNEDPVGEMRMAGENVEEFGPFA